MSDGTSSPERTIAWARRKAPAKQDRKWVESKARQGHSNALIKHVIDRHLAPDAGLPCGCGYSDQDVVDMMDWSNPTGNAFRYVGPYRQYPRLIKMAPHLDHSAYCRMYVGFKSLTEIFGFFANTGATMDFDEFEEILNRRHGGSYMESEDMKFWVQKQARSTKTGQLNRWSRCDFLRPVVDQVAIAEVMLS